MPELVRQREALTGQSLVGVDEDEGPLAAFDVGPHKV